MAIFATCKQFFIMKKILYILFAAVLAVLAGSCKKGNSNHANYLMIDGVSKKVESTILNVYCYQDNKYQIIFYLEEVDESFELEFDGESHLGKDVDLSQKDPIDEPGWFWVVNYYGYDDEGNPLTIETNGDPDSEAYPAFESGTMYTENLGQDEDGVPTLRLVIKNGKVKGSDDKIHTIALNYKSKIPLGATS